MEEKHSGIRIEVATSYIDDQSEPDADRYVFAYTITISNEGDIAAKLLSRHWVITDANGKVQEVSGDGVVGEQPHRIAGSGSAIRAARLSKRRSVLCRACIEWSRTTVTVSMRRLRHSRSPCPG